METLAVAEVCRREKQRFLAVRVISERWMKNCRRTWNGCCERKPLARRVGAAAGSLLRRPSAVKDLWRLRETALVCSIRLAKFLEGVIEQLNGSP